MMENNDTPRTEAQLKYLETHPDGDGVWFSYAGLAAFARELERETAELAALKARLAETEEDAASYLKTIGLIREAVGDNGKRMLPELVEYCRELAQKGGGE